MNRITAEKIARLTAERDEARTAARFYLRNRREPLEADLHNWPWITEKMPPPAAERKDPAPRT